MRCSFLKHTVSLALACAAAATPLFAQVNSGAGSGGVGTDANWSVSWTGLASGSAAQAFVVTSPPSAWPNTAPNSYWISSNATASLSPNTSDNAHNYDYIFSQTFSSALTSPMTMSVWTDNFFHAIGMNGNASSGVTLDVPPGDFAAGSPRSFFLPTGTTSVQLYTYGDGTTDGVNVQFSSVPEPSSMALLGTGLIGLVPMIRRKRKV